MKELEDYSGFPEILRNFQTDYIGYVVKTFSIYNPFIDLLKTHQKEGNNMFDLCSGSGEPAISIYQKSKMFKTLTLSDKYPNQLHIKDETITYISESIDALKYQFNIDSVYTMFNAIHHFDDEQKTEIIKRIQIKNHSAYCVEILQPTLKCFIQVLFASTIGVLVLTPFIQPFNLKRLFFTYIIPINVFTIAYDGCVSVLKSRSAKQYRKLFIGFGNSVEVLEIGNFLSPLLVIRLKQT